MNDIAKQVYVNKLSKIDSMICQFNWLFPTKKKAIASHNEKSDYLTSNSLNTES